MFNGFSFVLTERMYQYPGDDHDHDLIKWRGEGYPICDADLARFEGFIWD